MAKTPDLVARFGGAELVAEDLNMLDEALAFGNLTDKRLRVALQDVVRAYRELRKLHDAPIPEKSAFEIVPLDGGVYLRCNDEDGIKDMDYDEAIAIGAALIRAGLEGRSR